MNWIPSSMAILTFMLVLLTGSAAGAESFPPQRPFLKPRGNEQALREAIRPIQGKTDAALAAMLPTSPEVFDRRNRSFESAVEAALALATITGDGQYRELAARACRAVLRDLPNRSHEELRSLISDEGGRDEQNFVMRDAAYCLAMLYHATDDREYARKAAVILARFAEQIPTWPIYQPHYGARDIRKAYPQNRPDISQYWDMAGFWDIWIYGDVLAGVPLAKAFDYIHGAGVMQDMDVTDVIAENALRPHLELQRRYGRKLGNMDGTQLRGILQFAMALPDPQWFHDAVAWVQSLYKTQFYADGWWHEGTSSYHKQIHQNMVALVDDQLHGYSDPPGFTAADGSRYDNLDMRKLMQRPFQRADHVMEAVVQPNGIMQVIHDTTFPQRAWWAPPMTRAESHLFGAAGHAILGTGEGDNMVQATLHFGGMHGHEHYDTLNLIFFAKGRELISETQYRPESATNSTREWHTATAGHVTVVVDEKNQTGRQDPHTPKREKQPEDAVPGVTDWNWRWRGHGNVMNDGKLRMFNTDFDQVQVVEADGERAYGTLVPLKMYRRTIALVKIGDSDCYVVDIFRVRGGQTHDYMLHSCLDLPHGLQTSIALNDRLSGTLHQYLTDLRSARTQEPWSAIFTMEDGSASLASYIMPTAAMQVIQGTAPAMRRLGTAPFLSLRHTGGESIFVAVHHPYTAEPLVQKVELLPLRPRDNDAVALRVTLANRVDTIFAAAGDDTRKIWNTRDGRFRFRGRFAHIAEGRGDQRWAYLIDGQVLGAGELMLRGEVSHTGHLSRTLRIEAGDPEDAFITNVPLPTDGSLDGHTLMIDLSGLLVQSFPIARIERRGTDTVIHTSSEPGMTIQGNLVKLEYFPSWGIKGRPRFRIAGSALLRASSDGNWHRAATGTVSFTAEGKELAEHRP